MSELLLTIRNVLPPAEDQRQSQPVNCGPTDTKKLLVVKKFKLLE